MHELSIAGQRGAVITRLILDRILQNTPHISPVRKRYGVQFVVWHSDLYSTSVDAVLYEISCYIRPRYNGTQLY